MNFLAPGRLGLLLLMVALVPLHAWNQRRRRHAAVRFTNVAMLAEVAPARPRWRRHLPAAAVGLALAALGVAIAEPVHAARVPKEAAFQSASEKELRAIYKHIRGRPRRHAGTALRAVTSRGGRYA